MQQRFIFETLIGFLEHTGNDFAIKFLMLRFCVKLDVFSIECDNIVSNFNELLIISAIKYAIF